MYTSGITRKLKITLAAAALGSILCSAVARAQSGKLQPPLQDTFDGPRMDTHLWDWGPAGVGPSYSLTGGRCELLVPGTSSAGFAEAGFLSHAVLHGDFDMQMDYEILEWPDWVDAWTIQVAFHAFGLDVHPEEYTKANTAICRGLWPYDNLFFWATRTDDYSIRQSITVPEYERSWCRVHIRRAAGIVSGSYEDLRTGQIHEFEQQPLLIPDDMRFSFEIWTWAQPTGFDIRVTYDNFKINSGHVVWLWPPTASATADGQRSRAVVQNRPDGAEVTLDASASHGDNPVTGYHWDFNNDGIDDAEGAVLKRVFPVGGPYTVRLRVTDEVPWQEGRDAITVTVAPEADPPTITITSPQDGALYAPNQAVPASYTANDALSGIAGMTGTVANGASIDTTVSGQHTFTVTATDKAGNTTIRSVSYTVACSGGYSSIASNFNGTAIPAGSTIWFNSVVKPSGLGAQPVTVRLIGQSITFSASGTNYRVAVPDTQIVFSPTATQATTAFQGGMWVTTVPSAGLAGNDFLSGVAMPLPAGLPGGINPVTWSGYFLSDTPGVTLQWKWGAAVYTSFSGDYNALLVKPVDDTKASAYQNSDHAGTPEAFKTHVIGGARGGGGSNYTGSYSGTASVTPCVQSP